MSGKSDFLDYEPLRRRRRADEVEREDFPTRTEQTPVTEFERKFQEVGEKTSASPSVPERTPALEKTAVANHESDSNWALTHGHTLSFIGLYLFTFFVFFRPYELSSLAWLSKSALITAIATLILFVPTQLGLENKITIRPREVNLVFALLTFALLSVPFATDKLIAWNSFVEFLKVVIMFVVMINVVRTEKRLKALLLLVLTVTVILSVAAVNDYRAGNLAIGGKRIAGVIGGLFDNPNDLALHLITFFPIVIGLLLGSRYLFSKLIYVLVAFAIVAGTIVTFSRGGFLGLIVVIGTLVWKLAKGNKFLLGIVPVVLVILFLFFTPAAYRERIATTHDASAESRTGELKRSLYLTFRHPLFGLGMGNYVVYSDTEHATHNAYTQVASELGLPAAIVYVAFLITAFKRVRRIPNPREIDKKRRTIPYLAIGLQASLLGYMVSSFFASVAYLWYMYYLIGYAICATRLYESSVAADQKSVSA